jgi:signal transduction histidine kinase
VGPIFSARAWLAMVYLFTGVLTGTLSFVVVVTGLALGLGLMPLAVLGLPVAAGALVLCSSLGSLERGRVSLMLDYAIAPPVWKRSPDGERRRRIRNVLSDASRWRQAAAAFVALPISVVNFSVAVSWWSVALALVALPAYNADLPRGGAELFGWVVRGDADLAAAVAVGVFLLVQAPHVTVGLASAQAWVDRVLLGPSRRSLAARVGELEQSRSRMMTAAESERRRIERDLHDGAQARLVSLAMDLGRAKARFADDPEGAKALLDQAHEESKAALAELRSLVRGVHPPVLSDRGLDAALSGLAAMCPVPVTLEVEMTARPSSTVEAVAYFVVAELLTNVAKHSGATRASVVVRSEGRLLRVFVRDDGRGGADPGGPGLAGLADRAQAVDGRLIISSPLGGPTLIEVQLLCER